MLLSYALRIASLRVIEVFNPSPELPAPAPPDPEPPVPPLPPVPLPVLPVFGLLIFSSSIPSTVEYSFLAFLAASPRLSDKSPALPAASPVSIAVSPILSARSFVTPPPEISNSHPNIFPRALSTFSVKSMTLAITILRVCKNGLNAAITPVPITLAHFLICSWRILT